jgi:hypothetical protein
MIASDFIRSSRISLLALALAIPACATDAPEQIAEEAAEEPAPIATLAASAPSNALGVTSWQILSEDDDVRVIGRGDDGQRRIEFVAQRDAAAPAERAHLEVVFPEYGAFEVARGGVVDGAATPFLQQLGGAVTADLAERTVPLTRAPLYYFLQGEGHLQMGWSMFGYSGNVDVNTWCQQGTRAYFDAYSSNGASCWVNRWTTDSPYDCRINLHYGISGWRTDTCNWFVYTSI